MPTEAIRACKPDSVPDFAARLLSFIWDRRHQRPLSTYPQQHHFALEQNYRSEPPRVCCIFGLSAHKVYPAPSVARRAVGSYPTFSPLPEGGIFSVTLAVKRSFPTACLPVRKYGTLRCPDFPPTRCRVSDKTTHTAPIGTNWLRQR